MPSGTIPDVAGIRNFPYQNDQRTYSDLQDLRFGRLKPIDVSKINLSIQKTHTCGRPPGCYLRSAYTPTTDKSASHHFEKQNNAPPQNNEIRASEDPRAFSSTGAPRSGHISEKSWIFKKSSKCNLGPAKQNVKALRNRKNAS